MRLFLFSDHVIPANRPLDEMMLSAVGTRAPRVVWIPAGSRPERTAQYFADRKKCYQDIGVSSVSMFSVSEDFACDRMQELIDCDILHLSGGDPYVFLRNLRATGVHETIKERAKRGGIIVGDSAGAMLMSPDIEIAKFDGRPVPADLGSLAALNLVGFEFHAHFGTYGASEQALCTYSRERGTTVYAAPDGAGLAILDGRIHRHGGVSCFENGIKK